MAERKTSIRLPHIACEITAQGVAAARADEKNGTIAIHNFKLAPGVVTPSLTAENVQDAAAVAEAITKALASVGGRGQEVIAVLPDSAIRTTVLDFDSLPERRQEAEATVRFRLRKSLPFDIDKAAVSFDSQVTPRGLRVVTSVVLQSVLEEYESAFRAAGSSPGVVMPSSLGALGAMQEPRPAMMLKVGKDSTAVAAASDGQLLLYRVLEGSGDAITAERLADDIYPSLVYYQDSYGTQIEQLLVSGVEELRQILPALEQQTGVRVRELIAPGVAAEPLRNEFAGAIGALL